MFDRRDREGGIVLAPRQALLLHRGDRHAVDQQGGGGIVIESGEAEDLHQYCALRSRSLGATIVQPCGSRFAARFAPQAKSGSRMKYWRVRMIAPMMPASPTAKRR